MKPYISQEGLQELRNYTYKSGTYTYLDNAMQGFWNWFVTLFPMVSVIKLSHVCISVGRP